MKIYQLYTGKKKSSNLSKLLTKPKAPAGEGKKAEERISILT